MWDDYRELAAPGGAPPRRGHEAAHTWALATANLLTPETRREWLGDAVIGASCNCSFSAREILRRRPEWRIDKKAAMKLIQADGSVLRHLSVFLRKDREVVGNALKSGNPVLHYESEEIRSDPVVVRDTACPSNFKLAHERFRGTREVVDLATRDGYGHLLRYVSGGLDDDEEFVLRAISNDGATNFYRVLRHASGE